ncbi:N-acetyltransferase [Clostridia bacterium]|nr:N-acetyltransferase [Clostridia bacterium]
MTLSACFASSASQTAMIRAAVAEDWAAIERINRDALGYDFNATERRLRDILGRADQRVFVAETDGAVVGYIHAADYERTYGESLKNIISIAVSQDARGNGMGRELLTAVEDWARSGGAVGVRLVSGFDRTAAHGFYAACGYAERKSQKNFVKLLTS